MPLSSLLSLVAFRKMPRTLTGFQGFALLTKTARRLEAIGLRRDKVSLAHRRSILDGLIQTLAGTAPAVSELARFLRTTRTAYSEIPIGFRHGGQNLTVHDVHSAISALVSLRIGPCCSRRQGMRTLLSLSALHRGASGLFTGADQPRTHTVFFLVSQVTGRVLRTFHGTTVGLTTRRDTDGVDRKGATITQRHKALSRQVMDAIARGYISGGTTGQNQAEISKIFQERDRESGKWEIGFFRSGTCGESDPTVLILQTFRRQNHTLPPQPGGRVAFHRRHADHPHRRTTRAFANAPLPLVHCGPNLDAFKTWCKTCSIYATKIIQRLVGVKVVRDLAALPVPALKRILYEARGRATGAKGRHEGRGYERKSQQMKSRWMKSRRSRTITKCLMKENKTRGRASKRGVGQRNWR
ncbi:hypothetical protein B0H16DRAFT_1452046 [Mycena metata]|uniref:Uncharacterized protein n=1 Tax=Mycena metata TaxID=1033252 RepID=A0AAD7JS23_9AGAR|nr:hypothetical protein B0H16DRAFT_1452046 [Mycena metata]